MINKNKNKHIINIQKVSYPKPTDDFNVLRSYETGRQVAQAIQGEWFKRIDGISCRFYSNKQDFHLRRLYARGKQPESIYKNMLDFNGDISYLNLDFRPVKVIPKFRSWVINAFMNRNYQVKAKSIDRESQIEREDYKKKIERDLITKDFNKKAEKLFGINMFETDPKQLPESVDEIDIHTDLKFKPSTEIAQEMAIKSVMEDNEFDEGLKYRFLSDLVDLGIGVAYNYFSPSDGIVYEYINPEDFIYSHTEDPFFKDCFYQGAFRNELLSTVVKNHPELTDDEIQIMSDVSDTWANYYGIDNYQYYDDNLDGKVPILKFCYKAVRKKIWKEKSNKTGGRKAIKRDDDFEVKGNGDRDFVKRVKREEIWFEGEYVLGTDILLKWEVMENQVRPKSATNKVISPFVVVAPDMNKGLFDSLVERMIPIEDRLKLIDLKIQQTIQMTLPDGQFIDVDGLAEIDLGNGTKYNPTEAFDMYMQTGSMFGRSNTYGGEYNNSRMPIQEIRTSSSADKLAAFERQYAFNIQMMKDVTGLSKMDGNLPDKEALVGLQKIAAYNSNEATAHILFGLKQIVLGLARLTSLRMSDIIQYADFKEEFIQKIGAGGVVNLEYFKDMHLRDYAIYLELELDDEQKSKLEQDLNIEVQNGTIGVEDKYEILNIPNLKYGQQILKIRKAKYIKEAQERKMQEIEAQKQANIQSAQVAKQADMEKRQMELRVDTELENIKHRNEMQKLEREYTYKMEIERLRGEYSIPKVNAQIQSQMDRDKMKEDRKDERTVKEKTMESRLQDQRAKEKDPIDFEGEDFMLKDFEL